MPSIISHAFWAYLVNKSIFRQKNTLKISFLVALSAMIPDMDAIGFKMGVPYESLFGHRGFTHSIFFALIWSISIYYLFLRNSLKPFWGILILFLATISHSILDAMTSGGLGVAFFSPWSNERYFFPWRPIQVSPMGIKSFISEKGLKVLKSEFKYIWIPALSLYCLSFLWSKKKKSGHS